MESTDASGHGGKAGSEAKASPRIIVDARPTLRKGYKNVILRETIIKAFAEWTAYSGQ